MKIAPVFLVIFILSTQNLFPQTRFSTSSPVLVDTTGPTLNTYIYAGAGVGAPFILLSLNFMAEVEEHYTVTLGTDALQELDFGGGGDKYQTLNFLAGYAVTHKSLHGVAGGGIVVVFSQGVRPAFSFRTDFIFSKYVGIGAEFRLVLAGGDPHGVSGLHLGILNLVVRF
jgi:hypothetical protein